ncbi:hypothetical protein ACQ86E_30310 [Bradyrhizobium betae]|uniref:hypothetical protein n=1 Tax=Bradyrhizobium betae TaxID=244734 RepID=UPI003D67099E
MFLLTEKIAPPPRQQIFDDRDREDAAIAKLAEEQRWIEHLIEALLGKLKRFLNFCSNARSTRCSDARKI